MVNINYTKLDPWRVLRGKKEVDLRTLLFMILVGTLVLSLVGHKDLVRAGDLKTVTFHVT